MMKKTFYHKFIPTKAEEECGGGGGTAVLVEIKDVYPLPMPDMQNPWKIRKSLTQYEVVTGRILVSFVNTFEHILRYWAINIANCLVLGHKVSVVLWDVTDPDPTHRKSYVNNTNVYFEMLPNHDYSLTCMDLFRDRGLTIDDDIGLYWDHASALFHFKLFPKPSSSSLFLQN